MSEYREAFELLERGEGVKAVLYPGQ